MSEELATTEAAPINRFADLMTKPNLSRALAKVLPKHLTPERFIRLVLDIAIESPRVMECTSASVQIALLKCAELGLEPGSALGHIYLIPYENKRRGVYELKPMIGYKGYTELAYRAGRVKRIGAEAFYGVEVDQGLVSISREPPDIAHKWHPDIVKDPEDLVGAYAVAELVTGGKIVVVLSKDEVHARRPKNYKSRKDSPWVDHPEAMWCKTAIRKLLGSGKVPLSPQMQYAVNLGDVTSVPILPATPFEPIDAEAIAAELGIDEPHQLGD